MTIGGNDNNTFIGAIVECGAAGLSTLGQGSPCQDQYGGSFDRRHPAEDLPGPGEVAAGRAERGAARDRVAILGYPWILPRTGGCFDKMPVATGDVPYLRRSRPRSTTPYAARPPRPARRTSTSAGSPRATTPARRRVCAGSSRCCRAPTPSSSTRTRSASGTWRSGRCRCVRCLHGSDRVDGRLQPPSPVRPSTSSRAMSRWPAVPGVLLDQVQQDPLQLGSRRLVGEAATDRGRLGQLVRLDDDPRPRARRLEQRPQLGRGRRRGDPAVVLGRVAPRVGRPARPGTPSAASAARR